MSGEQARPPGDIPADIAFLASHGIPPALLGDAARWARHWQVPASEAVLALELMPEEALYRALARELGLPFLPEEVQLGADAHYPEALHAGALPLAPNRHGLRYAIAPDGRAIRMLFQHRYRLSGRGFALTTPRRLARLASGRFQREIASEISGGLAARMPQFSVFHGLVRRQRAGLLVCAGLLLTGMALFPVSVLQGLMLAAAVVFLAMEMQRIACCLERPQWTARTLLPPLLADAELPVYTVIVALYRETQVVPQLLHALRSLDYPPAKLDINLVLEEDDTQTREAIEACEPPPHLRVLVAPAGRPRTKPRALNMALATARGRHVVVYDAEDIPDPRQLRLAATLFRAFPDAACLQAHLVIDNPRDGLLPSLFAAEYAALFDAVNPGLAAGRLPVLLGGTSNHLRTAVLRRIGGWDAWNVTEDADLGIRLARFGWRVMDLPSATREEAPITAGAWIRQRARWLKGWMQVCITHARHPRAAWRELGPAGFILASTLTFGTVLGALGMPLFMPASAWMLWSAFGTTQAWPDAIVLGFSSAVWIGGLLALMLPMVVGLRRQRRLRLLWVTPFLPVYLLMLSLAAWWGLLELLIAPHHWHKTRHGLSRRRTSPFTGG
ncbi:cellulose synthase/poly-beta-1,6-N-acetylglucosamine synthase-like glycosyltransferase [Pseudochelatococcus lubricantis]|uniref:Cellulose synthase/poly-beta-1,6-N-acetylglucosamine synthase-like glycosyltransferase n=1 Tax=Pseudochelatococcus lubricantis TaxID=1538102 RepID=A0ABX0UUR2_9HYPH|nr:glycosyltransferase [Pseudochelatococcus lubricantis]NIJ56703.1 cellulose synthase/poly-beta-1,6-N-acetylglucosamine synthase-like glycosyltransferase [Pseudochelatococcus lubricantis]